MELERSNPLQIASITFVLLAGLTVGLNAIGYFSMFVSHELYQLTYRLDPENAFLVITQHHLVQIVLGMVLVGILMVGFRLGLGDFGFRKEGFRGSLGPIAIFTAVFAAVQLVGTLIYVYIAGLPLYLNYRLSVPNFVGYFLFEVLLSGTSEEIVFRSLPLVIVGLALPKRGDQFVMRTVAVVISTVAFMVGHIGFEWTPFRITHIDVFQQLTCLVASLFYCWLFFRFRNLWAIMLTHNVLNGIVTLVSLGVFVTYPQGGLP